MYFTNQEEDILHSQPQQASSELLAWQDSEFIYHAKSPLWYAAVVVTSIILGLSLFFILDRDFFIFIVIAIIAAALIVIGNRKPHTIPYQLHPDGIDVNGNFHSFHDYKSFSIIEEAGRVGLELHPVGKIQFPTTVLFGQKEIETIMPVIVNNLPMMEKEHSLVDRLVNNLKL